MRKLKILFTILLLISINSFSQVGGDNTYAFLELPNSARVTALGGNNISLYDNDLNMVYYNPGLLRPEMHNNLSLSYSNYVDDINYGYASYAYNLEDIGTLAAGIYYMNYGKFTLADEKGIINGSFSADEYSFNLYYSRSFLDDSSLNAGVGLKTIYSALYKYYSFGFAIDAGINYLKPGSNLSLSVALKNLGIQLNTYSEDNREPLPFDLQAGVTYKTPHAPFRVSLGMNQLTNWNMNYDSMLESGNLISDDSGENNESFSNKLGNAGDEIMRHIVLGVEIVPTDSFFLAFGYNYQRRSELSLNNRPGMVGFSAGAGIKISRFSISYGVGKYHMGGSNHIFSISTDFGEMIK